MSQFSGLGLAVETPFHLVLLNPATQTPLRDAGGKEAFIDVLSLDSAAARKHQATVRERRMNMPRRAKVTDAEFQAEQNDLLAALTKGWYLVDVTGQPIDVPCTEASARECYGYAPFAFIRDQVAEAVADRANFMPTPSKS